MIVTSSKKILLATDGSDHADRAADMAGKLSKAFHAAVDVVHVLSDDDLVAPGMHSYLTNYSQLEDIHSARQAALESAGASLVSAAARRVEQAGGAVAAEEVLVGKVARQVADMAKHKGSDCIVMGRRGLGDVRGLLLGSVSHQVGQISDKTLITVE